MELEALISKAIEYELVIQDARPQLSAVSDIQLCLIVTSDDEIITGLTCLTVKDDKIDTISPVWIAVKSLPPRAIAKQMVKIQCIDDSVVQPTEEEIAVLLAERPSNGACEVIISQTESVAASSLRGDTPASDFLSGFDDAVSAPAGTASAAAGDFSAGFEVDENNPFFDASNGPTAEVKT
ncbi:MAG TPA: hypothetical protein DCG49_12050, partial [Ruminococcus sp.]|nr:hypothetical protein [Ruminococcus sp.]